MSHPPGSLEPVETDRIIASIAAGQHAAVSRRQLVDAGVPAHVVRHRVRGGLLIPMHAGVYRVAGSPVTWHQRIMAGTLAAGAGAVASHRAAGFLHGLGASSLGWRCRWSEAVPLDRRASSSTGWT